MPGLLTAGARSLAPASVQRALPGACDLLPLAAAFPARYPCLLESAVRGARARWDILFAFPQDALALHTDGQVRNARGEAVGTRFLDALDSAWLTSLPSRDAMDGTARGSGEGRKQTGACSTDGCWQELPFAGGWLLYLGYELAAEIEPRLRLPRAQDSGIPIALALRCPAAILVDHANDRAVLVAEARYAHLLDALQDDLEAAWHRKITDTVPTPEAIEEDDPRRFLDGVARVHDYLRNGDTFQVNLSRAWRARFAQAPPPAGIHASLRRANPAPFAGLMQQPGWAIACSSPERLLEVRAGNAQTRPIAGTRPRMEGDDDPARIHELITHPKERAEHVMLIDLERNDLGRICVPGSVVVDELMAVESYAHVHHIVSNVRGILRQDVTPGQAIAAVFPGGTITGCPKVRCMEIIAELEDSPRGPYTGALGYLDRSGDLDLNILIRTLQIEGNAVSFRAGAGIVADSDASGELAETRAKARGLLRALGVSA